jgi:hypothetical protein
MRAPAETMGPAPRPPSLVVALSILILPPLPSEPPSLASPTLRQVRRLILGLCGLLSTLALASTPADGPHPLALMASLLPLQLAGLLWVVARPPREAARRCRGSRPPANAGSTPAAGRVCG